MLRATLLVPVLAIVLAAAGAQAQQGRIAGVDRRQQGDTLVLTVHLQGSAGVHVSEPFHLEDRVRLYVDLNETATALDSAALAGLSGGNLIAVEPRARAGGIALVVDLHRLADYRVVQSDTALLLRLLARPAAATAVALPAPETVSAPARRVPDSPLLLLATLPAALLLLALRRRRTSARSDTAESLDPEQSTAQPTSPGSTQPHGAGRAWAVRTLTASGASTADVVRRTGLPRDAIHFLGTDTPAVSAASGSNYRQQPPGAPAAGPPKTH